MRVNDPCSVCVGGSRCADDTFVKPVLSGEVRNTSLCSNGKERVDAFDAAQRLHDDNQARLAKLHAAPAVKTLATFVATTASATGISFHATSEVTKETPVAELLAAWRGPLRVTSVVDVFNDNLNFTVDSWAKLEALNARMLPVMLKYQLLPQQDHPAIAAACTAFSANYNAIAAAIAEMEAAADGDTSIVVDVTRDMAAIAAQATAAIRRHGVILLPAQTTTHMLPLGMTIDHLAFLRDNLRASGVQAPALQLLYRATVDGSSKWGLLRGTKGKGPVLIVGREQSSGWLFGGYMHCGISDEGGYQTTPQSFVFTLTNPHGLPPTAWRPTGSSDAVHRHGRHTTISWPGALFNIDNSALEWSGCAFDFAFASRAPHGGRVFTGHLEWTASEVLVYRV